MSNTENGTAAPAAPIVPAGKSATVAPAAGKGGKSAPVAPAGKSPVLGKSLDGAAASSVCYVTVRGKPQPGEGTRLYAILSDDGRFGYGLRRGGDFLALAAPLAASAGLPAVAAGSPFAAPYTVAGVRQVVRMLASLNGVTNNRDQANAPATVAGHLPADVAVRCGLPRITRVAGARRPTGRAGTI